jgi:hypothetical protein
MVTEHEAERIFRDGLVLEDDVRWTVQPSNARWLQFGAFLDSPHETTLRLSMGVSVVLPQKYKILILRGEQVLRRLDVRGSHQNPPGASGEIWQLRTHKHRWTDRFGDKAAYTPADINLGDFTRDEYEATFRAFCKECHIDFRGAWSQPPESHQTQLDV